MKVLPLWQPWASLVAVEAKRVETRHWRCPPAVIGRRVAIHATQTKSELGLAEVDPFRKRLRDAADDGTLVMFAGELPLGAIVCTAVLDRCSEMTDESIAELAERDPDEHAFGLYEPGRFAFVLRDVERLAEPIPFKASQSKFSDVPDELLERQRWIERAAVDGVAAVVEQLDARLQLQKRRGGSQEIVARLERHRAAVVREG